MEASGDGGTVFVGTPVLEPRAGTLSPVNGGGRIPDCGVPGPGGVVKPNEGDGNEDRIDEDGDGVADKIGLKWKYFCKYILRLNYKTYEEYYF